MTPSALRAMVIGAALLCPSLWAAPAPDFALNLNGKNTTLVSLSQETVVYLDFWASWCGPCRYSFPFMNRLHTELGPKGLTVVAVNVDVDPEDAKPFLAKYPADFAIHYDPEGTIAEAYQVPGMPTSYLIKDGEILVRHVGFRKSESDALMDEVASYLKE
ncbi:TlpA family protein disulfide reductase [Ferrimonas balearica]|uniref:TlpA family protein disulfide reductase n=1 Tax=Ferrimonas balearica TaxID=44012 RepID=UPI001C9A2A14|nr:TlpA disulfide reductase family protein [Ferrimonas balearica]MBY5920563.1 TlpA family protein disulfide reductase [Ferrimonas balearica]MBY5996752.1 TlpA family protein disulfide reductase [Ferrimonas balearica]